MKEQRSVATRLATRMLGLPVWLLDLLAGIDAPLEIDGRVMNRQVHALLGFMTRLGMERSVADVGTRRVELRRFASIGMPRRTNVAVFDRVADLETRTVPVRAYRRYGSVKRLPAIVYYHGGGWATGDLDTHDGTCRLLADVTGCVVVAVDYRLAPEHPFPAATDDAVDAYRWVHGHAEELGIVDGIVGVMGDSAGATLAAVVAQQLRHDDRVPAPVAQCLVYPATEIRMTSASHRLFAEGVFLSKVDMEWFRGLYLPNESDWDDVRVSPLREKDLSGLAPAVVITAGFDPLRDEGMAYATAMENAGVTVVARCYDDLVHGFFGMGVRPGGMQAASEICAAMGDLVNAAAAR